MEEFLSNELTKAEDFEIILKPDILLPVLVTAPNEEKAPKFFSDWSTYGSTSHVNGILADGSVIWVASEGGIERWDLVEKIKYLRFGSEHNLPGNSIECLALDSSGNLWAGGKGVGLAYWDGIGWHIDYASKDTMLTDVYNLHSDKEGRMWVSSNLGLGIAGIDTGKITWTQKSHWLISTKLNCFDFTEDGTLVIGTLRGLYLINPENSLERYSTAQGLPDNHITSIKFINDDIGLIGTSRGLAVLRDKKIEKLDQIGSCITSISVNMDCQKAWIGTPTSLWLLDMGKLQLKSILLTELFGQTGRLSCVATHKEKTCVGYTNGLMQIEPTFARLEFPESSGFPKGPISCIEVDDGYNVWAGGLHGLWILENEKWKKLEAGNQLGRSFECISQVVTQPGDGVWASSWHSSPNGGVRFFQSGIEIPHNQANAPLAADAICSAGKILMVAYHNMIHEHCNESWKNIVELPEPKAVVSSLFLDDDLNIWCGTNNGLLFYDQSMWKKIIPDIKVMCFAKSKNGNLWVGTEKGLFSVTKMSPLKADFQLPASTVLSLCVDEFENLFIGTTKGLVWYRNQTMTACLNIYNSGLSGQIVQSMCFDGSSTLWIGTDAGVSQFRYQ
jgi:ligand-binding sensor domain-containing protein